MQVWLGLALVLGMSQKLEPKADTFRMPLQTRSYSDGQHHSSSGSSMTIEPASAVRRGTSAETGWFAAGGLLIAAGLVTAVSVFRQWSRCDADPPSEACVTLRATITCGGPGRHFAGAAGVVSCALEGVELRWRRASAAILLVL